MNNEEQLKELEGKIDKAIKEGNASELKILSEELAPIVKAQEMKEQIKISEEAQQQANNLNNPENPFSDIFDLDDTNTFDKTLAQEQAKEIEKQATKEHAKQFVKKPKKKNFQSNGFAEGFIFTLLIGFASGAVFTIAYILLKAGKYTFIM